MFKFCKLMPWVTEKDAVILDGEKIIAYIQMQWKHSLFGKIKFRIKRTKAKNE